MVVRPVDMICSQITEDAPLKPPALIKSIKSSVLYFNPVFQKQGKNLRLFISLFLTNRWEDIDKGWFLYLSVRENAGMETGAEHSATFFFWETKKEICDSLPANTVAFWDILFGLMLWCSEERGMICYVQLHESLHWSFYSLRSSFIQ